MSSVGVSDSSKLHLKRELTQIRKVARVLRDPGTISSWKPPLNFSRSAAEPPGSRDGGIASHDSSDELDSLLPARYESSRSIRSGKEKKVFLCNWKTHKSCSEKSRKDDEDGTDEASWIQGGIDDDDVRDSKTESYLGDSRSTSSIFMCMDTNLASPGLSKKIRKSKKSLTPLDFSNKHHSKEVSSRHAALGLGSGRDDSIEFLDDTEDYSDSEDLLKTTGISPLLLKLEHNNWSLSSSRFLKNNRREDSSYSYQNTPALSASSYTMYAVNPSIVGSCDGDLDLVGEQGCGVPCYWRGKTVKHRGGCRSYCSSSLSDTLRRTGSSILCGRHSSRSFNKHRKIASSSANGVLPLITYRADDSARGGSYIGTRCSSSSSCSSDGQRWPTRCRNQKVLPVNGDGEEDITAENIRSLSQKCKPMFFEDLVGQSRVVQSLRKAIKRGRIDPLYLFHGPRGTGKTSAARIFASALNCVATEEETKPCGHCKECSDSISGKNRSFWELDGSNKKGVDEITYLLKNISVIYPSEAWRHKVVVLHECHMLPSKTWLLFLKFHDNPLQKIVFIFVTHLDNVPLSIQARCQKLLFNKLKDADVATRLRKIVSDGNIDIESQALDLIAMNADGSLGQAETMLEQLSLLGQPITVNELAGVVSDSKLLDLLELAMASKTAETVKRARGLLDQGADPIVLMSQLASLVMDIIDENHCHGFFIERLKYALKLLSEAENQLRVSNDRATWFTATLLQLGSTNPSPSITHTRQSFRTTEDELSSNVSRGNSMESIMRLMCRSSEKLNDIWIKCIERCPSKTLRRLLYSHAKLVSISEVQGVLVAYVAFGENEIKFKAERFLSSIANSIESVINQNIDVRMIIIPETEIRKPAMNNKDSDETSTAESPLSDINEQRLDTAWMRVTENGTANSSGQLKAETNQVLFKGEDTYHKSSCDVSSGPDNNDMKILRIGKGGELLGYDSGSSRRGCGSLFCWNTNKNQRRSK